MGRSPHELQLVEPSNGGKSERALHEDTKRKKKEKNEKFLPGQERAALEGFFFFFQSIYTLQTNHLAFQAFQTSHFQTYV